MPRQPKSNSILYVKLASLDDLCRYASNFDYTASNIISVKGRAGARYMLMAFGEHIDDTVIAYYINAPQGERMVCYTYPSSGNQSENSHFVKEMGSPPNHYMTIMETDGRNLRKATKAVKVPLVRVGTPEDLIIAVIRRGVASESLAQLYAFEKDGKTVLCAFNVIEELSEGPMTLYYAVSDRKHGEGFARYKYTDNKVDFTGQMGEHSYMYAKIINLAESFSFFKMPE